MVKDNNLSKITAPSIKPGRHKQQLKGALGEHNRFRNNNNYHWLLSLFIPRNLAAYGLLVFVAAASFIFVSGTDTSSLQIEESNEAEVETTTNSQDKESVDRELTVQSTDLGLSSVEIPQLVEADIEEEVSARYAYSFKEEIYYDDEGEVADSAFTETWASSDDNLTEIARNDSGDVVAVKKIGNDRDEDQGGGDEISGEMLIDENQADQDVEKTVREYRLLVEDEFEASKFSATHVDERSTTDESEGPEEAEEEAEEGEDLDIEEDDQQMNDILSEYTYIGEIELYGRSMEAYAKDYLQEDKDNFVREVIYLNPQDIELLANDEETEENVVETENQPETDLPTEDDRESNSSFEANLFDRLAEGNIAYGRELFLISEEKQRKFYSMFKIYGLTNDEPEVTELDNALDGNNYREIATE